MRSTLTESSLAREEPLGLGRAKPIALTVSSPSDSSISEARPVLPPSATSTEAATAIPYAAASGSEAQETVLSQVDGLVLNEAGDNMLVRFNEQNLTLHFPRELLPDELSQPGTGVTYQIVRRTNGIRYQRFVQRSAGIDPDRVRQVTEALGRIRFRGQ